ncbi:hypothetical protein [Pyrococcus horikoshii]|uniref:Uncharacterized protein n=2 Tax=Pyrococcus horikoshii TaxID=53953 RepID=O58148_PYRHO|nr:hypothetical protein [Pyrococcus horikoshii]BAA29496.1 156aa long hypothetical protein [Pyrococcus horikoshii OT3]HII61002.1 hypothetical protein [Pyrococcus horikoshii]
MEKRSKKVKVHREKFERAVELLENGVSPRRVAKELGLSLNQVYSIAEHLDIYLDLRELEEEVTRLRKTRDQLREEIATMLREVTSLIKVLKYFEAVVLADLMELEDLKKTYGALNPRMARMLFSLMEYYARLLEEFEKNRKVLEDKARRLEEIGKI